MSDIHKVAILGASGNFGAPITAALIKAGFEVTIISREESCATFPDGIPAIKIQYTHEELTKAMVGQDATVCVIGPAGMDSKTIMVDAAEAAGVKRFIVNDFGWGPTTRGLPEFGDVHAKRREQWSHAEAKAQANPGFTWTGITIGNPVDWALRKFPTMGFDVVNFSAIIYDKGEEYFTGTTLEGIGQSVVGVLQHPNETANRFVKVLSIKTCQNELLRAFQHVTGKDWDVQRSTTKALRESGSSKREAGVKGWVLDLAVAQMFDEGEARNVVASSREESDAELLVVPAETAEQIVAKALAPV
ncbi:hypothetical protein VP1G_05858 [Cytospora mali]|uniref:NAD(P)-binding domain-containing protein n=1 Tax=Cytospora mali TaxID=578113 RepID=A0A194V3P3_CYTMA|nr:hypothetical protein VP1G_05858 [Valsa mali var. pyri (nom. inval.)]